MAVIKKHKKLFIILAVILVLIIIAVFRIKSALSNVSLDESGEGVTVVSLNEEDLSDTVNADGKVESRHVVAVTTELTSKCTQLNVALGDHVEAGDILCVFDTEDIDNQISTLESSSASAAALARVQTQIASRNVQSARDSQTAQLNEQSAKVSGLQSSLASIDEQLAAMAETDEGYQELKTQREETATALNEALAEYDALVVSTNNAIQEAQDNYDTTALTSSEDADVATQLTKLYRQKEAATISAEQSGIITSLNISQGGVANGTLMVISDPTSLQVSVSVREKDILKMQEGMSARIKSDALGSDTVLSGTVARVINFTSSDGASVPSDGDSAAASGASSTGYSADINVNDNGDLLLGMSVKVEIVISDAGEKQAAPLDSIIKDGKKSYVLVARERDGVYTLKKTAVSTGVSNDYYTEVASENLKKGDLIVVNPEGYSDGDEVLLVDVVEEINESLEEEE